MEQNSNPVKWAIFFIVAAVGLGAGYYFGFDSSYAKTAAVPSPSSSQTPDKGFFASIVDFMAAR